MPLRPAPLSFIALLLVASLALSGCAADKDSAPSDGTPTTSEPTEMTILGLVEDEAFKPIAGATVTLRLSNQTVATDAGGAFRFAGLPISAYVVDVVATGFENATLTAEPKPSVSLNFVLLPPVVAAPPPVTVHYTGYFQCAFDAVFIPGSCDILLDMVGQGVLEDLSTFEAGLGPGWATAVVDLDFDGQPGLDGLRVTLRGKNDSDQLATYEQYGRFSGQQSFSFRIEPGQTYPDGVREVPANATALQMDVYPQGYLYHPAGIPILGVGVGVNVQFDLYVTVFYVEPAPEGFTLLG